MDQLEIIDEIIKLIENELKSIKSLDYVAKKLGFSKNYLNRIFNNTIGITVLDYIKLRKITEGIREYRVHRRNIIDVAFEYGFNSHEVFIRNCKKYYEKTPGELIVDKSWKGLDRIKNENIWFSQNRDKIVERIVKLPELIISKSSRGNINIKSLGFKGFKSTFIWDIQHTYKLIPKGIYYAFKVGLNEEKIINYLEVKYPNSGPIIEVKNNEYLIYYIKKVL